MWKGLIVFPGPYYSLCCAMEPWRNAHRAFAIEGSSKAMIQGRKESFVCGRFLRTVLTASTVLLRIHVVRATTAQQEGDSLVWSRKLWSNRPILSLWSLKEERLWWTQTVTLKSGDHLACMAMNLGDHYHTSEP